MSIWPWSAYSIFWRSIVFLLGMLLICFILGLIMRGCDRNGENPQSNQELPYNLNDPNNPGAWPGEDPFKEKRDSTPIEGWNDSIPNVKELPKPEDNKVPPVDSTRIVPNPEDSVSRIVAEQLVVFFNSKDKEQLKLDITSFAQQFKQIYPSDKYQIQYYNPATGTMLLIVPQDELVDVINTLNDGVQGVDFVIVTNEILAETYKPQDPGFSVPNYNEYFELIQAYDAWDVTKGDPEVKVAIVDSYFDLSHPELAGRYINPIHIPSKTANVYPPSEAPNDMGEVGSYCHGSHVAGLAIGAQDNGMGASGIAPNCQWIPVSLGNQLTTLNIIEGILYAIYQGADVINLSLGAPVPQEIIDMPVEEQVEIAKNIKQRGEILWKIIAEIANQHNCVLVTAAGNDGAMMGFDSMNRNDNMIKVEAVDGKGMATDFSNFGNLPQYDANYSTVAAPGMMLWSSTDVRCTPIWEKCGYNVDKVNGFQEMPGTSMASPVVAGAVALMKSKNKSLSTEDIIKILKMTGKQTDTTHPIGPTIQIRDALDAVPTLEELNFNDLMKNHDLLIGKWKSTHEINLVSNSTGDKIDEMWAYFTFPTTEEGILEYRTINDPKTYTAKLKVDWRTDEIFITQLDDARTPGGDNVTKDDFVCRPDTDGSLKTTTQRNGSDRFSFKLQKVN